MAETQYDAPKVVTDDGQIPFRAPVAGALPSEAAGDPGIWVTDGARVYFLSAAGKATGSTLQVNTALTPPFEWVEP